MKNRNTKFTAILFVLAFALASIVQARPGPSPRPTHPPANDGVSANSEANSAYSTSSEGENLPVVTIHSTGNIPPGEDRFIRAGHEACTHVRWNVRKVLGQRHRYPRSGLRCACLPGLHRTIRLRNNPGQNPA